MNTYIVEYVHISGPMHTEVLASNNGHKYLGLLEFAWQQIYYNLQFLQAGHLDG